MGHIRESIRSRVARHAPSAGTFETCFEEVELFRVVEPLQRMPGIYSPCVCIIVAGAKTVHLEETCHTVDEHHYVCATLPTPIFADAPDINANAPLLGVTIKMNTNVMSRLVLEMQAAYGRRHQSKKRRVGFGVVSRDNRLDSALANLLELLDDPPAAQILGEGRLRELFFAILQGDAGQRVQGDFGTAPALASTLAYVHDNIAENFSVDALARRTGMSRAAFDRQFKTATLLSPLQYIKALRLSEASMLLARGESIGDAATTVGYHNPSQFSREFRRKFGQSPREWAKGLARSSHGLS